MKSSNSSIATDRVGKVVGSRRMSIIFISSILSSCGAGTPSDQEETETPISAAAMPTQVEAPDELTDETASVTALSGVTTVKPEESNLSIAEVMEIALLAIDNPEPAPEESQSPATINPLSGVDVTGDTSTTTTITNETDQKATDPEITGSDGSPSDAAEKSATDVETEQPASIGNNQSELDSETATTGGTTSVPETDLTISAIEGLDEKRPADMSFSTFQQNDLPDKFRTMFGCGGTVEERWLTIPTDWPKTWSVSSRDEFDMAVINMDDGDRILIEEGTNLGSVELSSSGSPDAKKYIMGNSYCGDSNGPTTFSSNARFTITGNDWVVMNLNFLPSGQGRAFKITGARNWIYNNRIDNAGEVLFEPLGTADAPTTTGNRIVGNFFNGSNDKAGVRLLNPFTPKNGPSVHDLVIGGNTFENYQEDTFSSKVITDVSFGWNYPYDSDTDFPGKDTFTELGWNHFIDCHGEVPTSKTRRWMIHDNLFEVTPAFKGKDTPHISLRSGDDKLVFRNIFLDGNSRVAQTGVQLNGKRSYGYYNVVYRSDNGGIGFAWTTSESFSYYPFSSKTFMRNERLEDIDWRYNFFLGDGGDSASWMRFVVIGGYHPLLPPRNNTVKENFYSSENPSSIDFLVTDYKSSGLGETDWNNNNPNATRQLQHFAYRNGDESTLDEQVTVPGSVTVEGFWMDGEDITIELPPWIGEGTGHLINVER